MSSSVCANVPEALTDGTNWIGTVEGPFGFSPTGRLNSARDPGGRVDPTLFEGFSSCPTKLTQGSKAIEVTRGGGVTHGGLAPLF